MSPQELAEESLKIAIKYNNVIDYLEGKPPYVILTDPRDLNSPHAYYFSIACYNDFNKKNPQLQLDKLFEKEIIAKLSSDKCNFFDTYCLFKCIMAQLRLETEEISSFKINDDKLKEILELLKKQIIINQEVLKRCKLDEAFAYNDGVYGYILHETDRFFKETGRKVL